MISPPLPRSVTVEWLNDFEEADIGMAEMEPGSTLAVVFRPGDQTEVTIVSEDDGENVTLTARGFPEPIVVPKSAFRIIS